MSKVKSIQAGIWLELSPGHQSTLSLANSYTLFIIHLNIDHTHLAEAEAHAANTESHYSKRGKASIAREVLSQVSNPYYPAWIYLMVFVMKTRTSHKAVGPDQDFYFTCFLKEKREKKKLLICFHIWLPSLMPLVGCPW